MLKKLLVALTAVVGLQATAVTININLIDVKDLSQKVLEDVGVKRIPWKVNDSADYKLNLGGFLDGTMKMFVREETSEGLWLEQDIDMMIQKSKVETLLDKETGAVKKVLVDGKEQKSEGGEPPEIVDSKPDTVTVPAGTFECSYLKLKNKSDGSESELWINPDLVPMVGLIKQVAQSQIGPVTLELTGFNKQ